MKLNLILCRPQRSVSVPAAAPGNGPESSPGLVEPWTRFWDRLGINWRIGYVFGLLLALGTSLPAQGILEEYVREGLQSNLALRSHNLQVARSMTQLRQAKANFFPKIAFDANYTLAGGGRTIDFPIGDLLNPVYATLNQLTQSDEFPQLGNVSEQFLPNNFHETKLSLTQPLFNSDVYFGYKARQAQVEVEKARKAAYAQNLAHEIRIAYFNHLQAREAVAIYQDARKVLLEVRRVNEKLVAQQKATPDVVASSEAEIARLDQQLAEAEQQVAVSASWFNFLLNRDLDTQVLVDPDLPPITPTSAEYAELAGQAEANRQELQALRMGIRANETLADMKKYDALLPDVYLAGQAGFQGFGYTFDENQDFWLAQVGLTWDLFQGQGKRAARDEADLQVQLLENEYATVLQQLKMQVMQAREGLKAAVKALDAAQSEQNAAAKAFRLIDRRYTQGQAMLVELLRARNQLTSAQISYNIARFRVFAQQSELNKATAAQ
ncbi:MAG: TolC family protein [Bacteroidota bacterium]